MQFALKEAHKAFDKGEVPVGAVIVFEDHIIAAAHNQVELLRDATAHAEMLAITAASDALGNWRLSDTTLYTTLEPCAMCFGAMLLSRIHTIVWSAPDLRHGANGSWIDLTAVPHPTHTPIIRHGILHDDSHALLRTFFRDRRECR